VFCLSEAFGDSLVRGLVSREVASCDELLLRPLGDHLHPDAFVVSSLAEWLPTPFRGFPSSWEGATGEASTRVAACEWRARSGISVADLLAIERKGQSPPRGDGTAASCSGNARKHRQHL